MFTVRLLRRSSKQRLQSTFINSSQPANPSLITSQEAASSRIDLPEDDVDTITLVLTFCYLQDYSALNERVTSSFSLPLSSTEPTTDPSSVTIARNHLRVYIAADKFNIEKLKHVARCNLIDWAYAHWPSASFPSLVQDIWCSVPPNEKDLRDRITAIVAANIQHFMARSDGKNVLINNAESAVAVLKLVADREAQLKAATPAKTAMPAKRRKTKSS